MNKYDKAVLAKLEQLCTDGGLEYRHPDPNDRSAFDEALEYYTDAGRSDLATLLTGAVVPVKFDESEKQVKAGSRRDSANELGERVVLKDDSLGRRRLNNKSMILAGLAAGAALLLFVVWKNAFAFPTDTKVVVTAPDGSQAATAGTQGTTPTTVLPTTTTAGTATTATTPATSGTQAQPTAEAMTGSEPTQPVSVPERPYEQPYVQQAPPQATTPPTFQQVPAVTSVPSQPVAVSPSFRGQQLPVRSAAAPVQVGSVPSISQTPPVTPYRLVPRTLTPPVTVRTPAPSAPRAASTATAAQGATVVYRAPAAQAAAGLAYTRPADAAASSAPGASGGQTTVFSKANGTAGDAAGSGASSGVVYNRSGGLSDPAAGAGSLVAYRNTGATAVSADSGTAQRVVYQRTKDPASAGGVPADSSAAPANTQTTVGTPVSAGTSGLTSGLNALSGGATTPVPAGAATVASLTSGSTTSASVQNPYRKGQRLKAKLLTGFATANGAAVPVLAQSEDGATWIGSGTLINGTLVQIDFRTAVFADGQELDVTASAFSSDGYPGVEAQVTDTNPTLVTDILRGAASGASDYVTGLVNAGTNVVLPSGGVVTSKASASLGDNILGAVGGLFKIPNVSSNFVRVARLSQDTPIQIVYGVSNSGR